MGNTEEIWGILREEVRGLQALEGSTTLEPGPRPLIPPQLTHHSIQGPVPTV